MKRKIWNACKRIIGVSVLICLVSACGKEKTMVINTVEQQIKQAEQIKQGEMESDGTESEESILSDSSYGDKNSLNAVDEEGVPLEPNNKTEDSETDVQAMKSDFSIVDTSENGQTPDGIDLDLTTMSATMVYSEVYNMMYMPEDYVGKTIRMKGLFSVFQNTESGKLYFGCIIQDATACCAQGIEFELEEERTFPEEYPEVNSEITVQGSFITYEEDGYLYCKLIHASMEYDNE